MTNLAHSTECHKETWKQHIFKTGQTPQTQSKLTNLHQDHYSHLSARKTYCVEWGANCKTDYLKRHIPT